MNSCTMTPLNREGEIPLLYKQLVDFFGDRKKALIYYNKVKTDLFKQTFPEVNLNSEGDPLMEDLINKVYFTELLTVTKLCDSFNKKYDYKDKRYSSVMSLLEEATRFNRNSPFRTLVYASITEDDRGVKIVIKPVDSKTKELVDKMEINSKLNRRLEQLINSWGFNVGALSDYEERLGVNGVMDLNAATNTANGIKDVIRVAKGQKGVSVLPEEFAHLAVELVGDIPLKQRILSNLANEDVMRQILGNSYDDYAQAYNNNLDILAEEALGKLVAQALNNLEVFYDNPFLFGKFLESFKNQFNDKDASEIDRIIKEVMAEVLQFTNDIVLNKYDLNVDKNSFKKALYNLESNVNRENALLEHIIDLERKRLKIYGKRNTKFSTTQIDFIRNLEKSLATHESLKAITQYMQNSIDILNLVSKRLRDINTSEETLSEKFKVLRNVRDYVSSYGVIMKEISNEINNARRQSDDKFVQDLSVLCNKNLELIGNVTSDFYFYAKDLFVQAIKPFVGDHLAITIGRDRHKKVYTAELLIESLDKDITIWDRWLDSAADSSDPMIQIYDQIVKKQKGLARLKTIETMKEIQRRSKILEEQGIKDTSWMYERDDNGVPTGYFVTEIDWNKYYKEKKAFFDKMKEKYGENPDDFGTYDRNIEIKNWYLENTTKDSTGFTIPKLEKFASELYAKLNDAQKEYHSFMMELKSKLDKALPGTNLRFAPQIRRDFMERMKNGTKPGKYLWESMKDNIIRREDDEDIRDKAVLMDFEGNQVTALPVYYTRELDDMNDLSLDATSAMIAYASMAYDYNEMSTVIDTLEVGRVLLLQRNVTQTDGNRVKKEKFAVLGRQIEKVLLKKGDVNFFMQKLNTFMEMQVYGMQQKDEGSWGKVDKGKAANLLNKLTSLGTTAMSVLTGSANFLLNSVIDRLEAKNRRFFTDKELTDAGAIYSKNLPARLAEFGKRIKTNKLDLFSELFNVSLDYKADVRNAKWDRKTWASQLADLSALYYTTSAGDHFNQHRLAIALALRQKLKDNKGNEINLWDALEVVPVDGKNLGHGARLLVKKGVKKFDGTDYTQDDIILMSNKIRATENMLYGIYNSEDKNALLQVALGRLVMFYRNWMRPLWLKRYGRAKYNFDLGCQTEGYFQTFGRFVYSLMKDIKNGEFNIVADINELKKTEDGRYLLGNIRLALTELTFYVALYGLIGLLDDDDDDADVTSHAKRMLSYSLLRLRRDLGALLPTPTMLDEGSDLLSSPFAAMSYIKKLRKLLDLVWPPAWDVYTTEIKSGPYKGMTEAEKSLIDVLPFVKPIVNAIDPSGPARWYK